MNDGAQIDDDIPIFYSAQVYINNDLCCNAEFLQPFNSVLLELLLRWTWATPVLTLGYRLLLIFGTVAATAAGSIGSLGKPRDTLPCIAPIALTDELDVFDEKGGVNRTIYEVNGCASVGRPCSVVSCMGSMVGSTLR